MENNEFNNNEENKIEETVSQEPNKSKKKTAIILVIGLVTFTLVVAVGITLFWIKSFDGTSKTGHTESPFSTNNKDTSNTNTSDNESVNNVEEDSENIDAEQIISFFQPRGAYQYGENMLESSATRLQYVNDYLNKMGLAKTVTAETIQPASSVELEVYKSKYLSVFGNNYVLDLDKDLYSVWGGAVLTLCNSYPSVNDGNHVCWDNYSLDDKNLSIVIDYRDSGVIRGTYSNNIGESGTFEIIYTEGKYLKSIVLTKTN